MSHVMLDLETWGRSPDGAIVSIGAVNFDISTGNLIQRETERAIPSATDGPMALKHVTPSIFHVAVDAEDCRRLGMSIDGNTVYWWFRQDPEAINAWLQAERLDLRLALLHFKEWFTAHRPKAIWGNSPSFDCEILSTAYQLCGLEKPWNHRQERCVRTYVHAARMAGYPKQTHAALEDAPRRTKHDALGDCLHQIMYVNEIWQYLQKAGRGQRLLQDLCDEKDLTSDLRHRIRYLLREMRRADDNLTDEQGGFTFPDGEHWVGLGDDDA